MTFSIYKRIPLCLLGVLFGITAFQTSLFSNNPPSSSISLICPTDISIGIFGNSCAATVQLPMPQVQMNNCGGNPSFFVSSPFGIGLGPHTNVPAGTYKINYRAISPCGDTAVCSSFIHIEDKKKPVPVLVSALYANILATGKVRVYAWQFNQGSFDNCSANSQLRFSFSSNSRDTVRDFSCEDIGMKSLSITVWDAAGNTSIKATQIGVLDNDNICTDQTLRGKIEVSPGVPLPEALIEVQGGGVINGLMTGEDGAFILEDLDATMNYVVTPKKDNDILNGINSYDLYRLHKHLVGSEPFTHPHQYISADVNRDKKVSTSDLLLLQECILGIYDKFPNNTSWRFLDKNYNFLNVNNPQEEHFSERIVLEATNNSHNAEFWAIKIGDTDMSTSLLHNPIVEDRQDEITYSVKQVSPTQLALKLNIPTHLKVFEGVIYTSKLPFKMVAAESNNPSLHTALFSDNLKFSWYHDGAQLLESIIFLTIPSTKVSFDEGSFTLDDPKTISLGNDGIMYQASFNFTAAQSAPVTATSALRAHPNSPNPFMEFTMLPFTVELTTEVLVRIFDAAGQLVHEVPTATYEAGEHRILLMRAALKEPGIYTCSFESKIGSATRKLMLL